MRRCARSMKQMNRISPATATMIATSVKPVTFPPPVRAVCARLNSVVGRLATIPAMMISDMPLPIPRLVILLADPH